MSSTRQATEHFTRLIIASRLAKNTVVEHDDRVCGNDELRSVVASYDIGFFASEAQRVVVRFLAWQHTLVDVGRPDPVSDSDQCEQLAPARRSRREDY
jgi:hypothetical protein